MLYEKFNISPGEQVFDALGGNNLGMDYYNNYKDFEDFCNTLYNSGYWRKFKMTCNESNDLQVVMRNSIVSRNEVCNKLAKDLIFVNITFHKLPKSETCYFLWQIRVKYDKNKNGYYDNYFYVTSKVDNASYLSFNGRGINQFMQFSENVFNAENVKHKRNVYTFAQQRLFDVDDSNVEYDIEDVKFYDLDGNVDESLNFWVDKKNSEMDNYSVNKKMAEIMKARFDDNQDQIPTKEELVFMKKWLNFKPFYEKKEHETKADFASSTEAWKEEIVHDIKTKTIKDENPIVEEKVVEAPFVEDSSEKTSIEEPVVVEEKDEEVPVVEITDEMKQEVVLKKIIELYKDVDNEDFIEAIDLLLAENAAGSCTLVNLKKIDFEELLEAYNSFESL